jgi:gephyrin
MSRPVAGVRNKTVIVTLPGSPKGAKENLLAVLKLLPHACMQAAGADSRSLHAGGVKQLEKEAGIHASKEMPHGHHHHHRDIHPHGRGGHTVPIAHTTPEGHLKSNVPQNGPTRRHRTSPYPMLPVAEALHLVLEQTPPLKPVTRSADCGVIGHVLAEDVQAKESVPSYRASIVDGYALIVSEAGPGPKGVFPVVSVSHANPGGFSTLEPGQLSRITTGAALPLGANSVVMVEDTLLVSVNKVGDEEGEVEILTDKIKANENVREIGSDIQAGEVVLRKGEELTAVGGELGLLASVGKNEVKVYQKPIVGVLSTGDEIIPHDRPGGIRLGEVRDSNRPSILAVVKSWGFEVVDLGIANDE